MKNKRVIAFVLLVMTIILLQSIFAFASPRNANNNQKDEFELSLPDPSLFQPDVETGGAGAKGVVNVINILIGIGGTIALGWGGLSMIKEVIPLIRGRMSLGQMKDKFIGLGIAALCVLLAMTGAWVPILYFAWNSVVVRMLNALTSSKA